MVRIVAQDRRLAHAQEAIRRQQQAARGLLPPLVRPHTPSPRRDSDTDMNEDDPDRSVYAGARNGFGDGGGRYTGEERESEEEGEDEDEAESREYFRRTPDADDGLETGALFSPHMQAVASRFFQASRTKPTLRTVLRDGASRRMPLAAVGGGVGPSEGHSPALPMGCNGGARTARTAADVHAANAAKTSRGGADARAAKAASDAFMGPAAAELSRLSGMDNAAAERALAATQQHCADQLRWMEEAMVWTAMRVEADAAAAELAAEEEARQAEIADLRNAMGSSLEEAERAKSSEMPLAQRSAEYLRRRFKASLLLPKLSAVLEDAWLMVPPLKEPLVVLLDLERKCTQLWYPGSGAGVYFQRFADRCASLVLAITSSADGSAGTGAGAGAGPAAEAAQAVCGDTCAAAGKEATCGARAAKRGRQSPPPAADLGPVSKRTRSCGGSQASPSPDCDSGANPPPAAVPMTAIAETAESGGGASNGRAHNEVSSKGKAKLDASSGGAKAGGARGKASKSRRKRGRKDSLKQQQNDRVVPQLLAMLKSEGEDLKREICKMPPTACAVPDVFRSAAVEDGAASNSDSVVIVEEVGPGGVRSAARQQAAVVTLL